MLSLSTLQVAGFNEKRFRLDGVELNHLRGPANGPPLLLFPGQTQPWQSYSKVLLPLAKHFEVIAFDIHGHGQSSFVPERYSYEAIGQDLAQFLRSEIDQPAFISGNSSGGVIALWLGARLPEKVRGLMLEDPPLFSSEWPRIKDCFIYGLLQDTVKYLADQRDLPEFFRRFTVPVDGHARAVTAASGPLLKFVASYVSWMQKRHPDKREVDLPLMPFVMRMMVRGFSGYDAEFARPFLDGSFGKNFDHGEALSALSCPVLLLRAVWFENEKFGLVGSMNDADLAQVKARTRNLQVVELDSGHVVHQENPKLFVRHMLDFKSK